MSSSLSGTLAVVSQSGETITFYDTATWQKTGQIRDLPAEPHELAYDATRKLLYVSHTYRHGHYLVPGELSYEISVVDVATQQVIDTIDTRPARAPHGLVLDAAHDMLYASVEVLPSDTDNSSEGASGKGEERQGGGIIGIDLKSRTVRRRAPNGLRPHWFVVTPDGRKAYTCNKSEGGISVLDLERGALIREIPVEGGTEHPDISGDGSLAFFPTPSLTLGKVPEHAAVKVVSTVTDEIVAEIPFQTSLQPLHVTARGQLLVGKLPEMPAEISNAHKLAPATLAVLDGTTHAEVGQVQLGGLPLTIRSSPDGRWAFVANVLPGTVTIVNLDNMQVVQTLENDVTMRKDKAHHQGAHGLAFIPMAA